MVWKLGSKVYFSWQIKTVILYLTLFMLLHVTIVKLIQQVATWTITIVVEKYVFCSLSDHYSVNIPINPIRRVYEEDNERKFRYVRYWKYSYSCVGHTKKSWNNDLVALNSYCSLYRVYTFSRFCTSSLKDNNKIRLLAVQAFNSRVILVWIRT